MAKSRHSPYRQECAGTASPASGCRPWRRTASSRPRRSVLFRSCINLAHNLVETQMWRRPMSEATKPAAIDAAAVPPARPARGYPEPFATRVAGRERRALGDVFGLTNFGVNLTRLPPGGMSALRSEEHTSELQ